MYRLKFLPLFFSLILLFGNYPMVSQTSQAQTSASITPWLSLADYIPPSMTALDVQGNIAYVGAGPSLLAFDISNPDNPQRILYQLLPGSVQQVLTSTGRVYVLVTDQLAYHPNRIDKVIIFDTSRLPSLRWIGEYSTTAIDSLAGDEFRLYVGNRDGLSILDVQDTTQIHLLGILPIPAPTQDTFSSITAIQIQGNLAVLGYESYFIGYTNSLALWSADISDPAHPQKIGELALQQFGLFSHLLDLDIENDLVVATQEYEQSYSLHFAFQVVDFSDPMQPVHRFSEENAFRGKAVAELDNPLLYTGSPADSLKVYDLNNPANPQLVETVDFPAWDLVDGQNRLVSVGASGLTIFDRQSSGALVERGSIVGISSAEDLDIQNGLLVIADGGTQGVSGGANFENGGLAVGTVNTSGSYALTTRYTYPQHGSYLELTGNRNWLVGGTCSTVKVILCDWHLYQIDVSQIVSPSLLSDSLLIEENLSSAGPISIHDNLATITIYDGNNPENSGLTILDVSSPITPTSLSFYQPTAPIQDGVITGTYALVTDATSLNVLDATDPFSLTELTSVPMSLPGRVVVQGSLGFVADFDPQTSQASLAVIDLTQLPQIQVLTIINTAGVVLDAAFDGRYLYLAEDHQAGLQVFDLANIAQTKEIFAYDTPDSAAGVAVEGGLVFLADRSGGVFIFNQVLPQIYMPLAFSSD